MTGGGAGVDASDLCRDCVRGCGGSVSEGRDTGLRVDVDAAVPKECKKDNEACFLASTGSSGCYGQC